MHFNPSECNVLMRTKHASGAEKLVTWKKIKIKLVHITIFAWVSRLSCIKKLINLYKDAFTLILFILFYLNLCAWNWQRRTCLLLLLTYFSFMFYLNLLMINPIILSSFESQILLLLTRVPLQSTWHVMFVTIFKCYSWPFITTTIVVASARSTYRVL